MNVAIYTRVSTTDQNCDMQLQELRDYAARRGWIVTREYVDTGWSGTKASRPELDRLMRDASRRQFDVLLVYKLDRFGRSVLHLNQQLATLNSHGIRFISTSQSLDTDQTNPRSRLLLQILASVAEFERELISGAHGIRSSSGKRQRKAVRQAEARVPSRRGRSPAGREGAQLASHCPTARRAGDDGRRCLPRPVYGKSVVGDAWREREIKAIVPAAHPYGNRRFCVHRRGR